VSWRDGAAKVPQHEFDLAITDHYAPAVTEALRSAFPTSLLEQAVTAAQSAVIKSADPAPDAALRNAAKAILATGAQGSDLEDVLRSLLTDSYAAGAHAAGLQLGSGSTSTLAGVNAIDWSSWVPGNASAGALMSNGGFATLLDNVGASVKGITGSLLDQLGNTIGSGVAAGDSVSTIGRSLSGIIGSPSRAEMIAHTETARAVTQGTLNTYALNGVNEWDWILSDGACAFCEAAAAAGPYSSLDAATQPPGHPRCRCSASPHVSSIQAPSGGVAAGGMPGDPFLTDGSAAADVVDETAVGDAADAGSAVDDLSGLSDDELASALGTADEAQADRILTELDARDEAAKAEQKAAASRARSQARRDADKAAKSAKFDELVAGGKDPLEAYADAFGADYQKLRVKDALAQARANGYVGRNLVEVARNMQRDWAEQAWLKAEDDTRGHLLNHEAEQINASISQKSISAKSLFSGSDARARKWASDELLEWWEQNGRLTVDDFQAGLLGGKVASKAYFL